VNTDPHPEFAVHPVAAPPATATGPVVTFVTRTGCHLCDVAWSEVLRARERQQFEVRRLDVDSDPELRGEYGDLVPVVLLDGDLFSYFEVNVARLLAAVAAHHVARPGPRSNM
jgi:hypothetical protein